MECKIKNRYTGVALYSCEIQCDADTPESVRMALAVREAYRDGASLYEADLVRADLEGANLVGANLCEADLSRAFLNDADLRGANLDRADLSRAFLIGANLRGANLRGATLCGATLRDARLDGASLDGANLEGASLRDASLVRADLDWANLDGATYGPGIPMTQEPIQISGLRWSVLILDSHIKIGCEMHTIDDWEAFNDRQINQMDRDALKFWKTHKDRIISTARRGEA